jgi:Leucine-rich repeat (LRR) protein
LVFILLFYSHPSKHFKKLPKRPQKKHIEALQNTCKSSTLHEKLRNARLLRLCHSNQLQEPSHMHNLIIFLGVEVIFRITAFANARVLIKIIQCLTGHAWVQDHHLLALPTAQKLRSLNLSHCESLTANSLIYLQEMSSLTFLDLSYCRCDLSGACQKASTAA